MLKHKTYCLKILITAGLIILLVLVSSCRSKDSESDKAVLRLPAFQADTHFSPGETTVVFDYFAAYQDKYYYRWDTEWLYSVDYETGEKRPVCAKAGCQHDEGPEKDHVNCDAWFEDGILAAFSSDASLYIFCDRKNGGMSIWKTNENGSERRLIAEGQYILTGPILYAGGKVYFTGAYTGIDAETGTFRPQAYYLGCFDTETEEVVEVSEKWSGFDKMTLLHTDGERLYFIWEQRDREYTSMEEKEKYPPEDFFLCLDIRAGTVTSYIGKCVHAILEEDQIVYARQEGKHRYAVYQKKLPDGDPVLLRRTRSFPMVHLLKGKAVFTDDLTGWQKEVIPGATYLGEYMKVVDTRKPLGENIYMTGIMRIDDYLNGIDRIIYDEE